jgi:hypothetical protein
MAGGDGGTGVSGEKTTGFVNEVSVCAVLHPSPATLEVLGRVDGSQWCACLRAAGPHGRQCA